MSIYSHKFFAETLKCVIVLIFLNLGTTFGSTQSSRLIILDVAWSPDGEMIAAVDNIGKLEITFADQAATVIEFTRTVPDLVKASVSWSPLGDRFAAGIGNRMYVWDATSWQLLYDYEVGAPSGLFFDSDLGDNNPEGVQNITWSLDGKYMVVGTYSYEISVWDMQEEELIFRDFGISGGGPGGVWLGDGWLGDGFGKLNIFSGEEISPTVEDIQNRFGGNAVGGSTEPRPDNTQMAWGDRLGSLVIYDPNTLRGITAIQVTDSIPPAPRRSIADISWDGTWNFIAVVSRDGELYIANLLTKEVATVLNIDGRLNAVDWNPVSNEIVYAGVSSTGESILEIVDVTGIAGVPSISVVPTVIATPSSTAEPIILDVAWSPDGEMLARIDNSGKLEITFADQTATLFEFTRTFTELVEAAVVWSPLGDRLAAGIGNRMYIWATNSWQLVHEFEVGASSGFFDWGPFKNIPEGVKTITWSLDSRYVNIGTHSYETILWDNQTSQMLYREADLSGGGPGRVWIGDGWLSNGGTQVNIFTGERIVDPIPGNSCKLLGNAEAGSTEANPQQDLIAWGDGSFLFLTVFDLNTLCGVVFFELMNDETSSIGGNIADIAWDGTGRFIAAITREADFDNPDEDGNIPRKNNSHIYMADTVTGELEYILMVDARLYTIDWNPVSNEIVYAGVSSTGEPIIEIVDVTGIAGVPPFLVTP